MVPDEELENIELPEGIHLSFPKELISPQALDAVQRYWTRKDGRFTETVEQIAKSLGMSAGKVPRYISKLSVVVSLMKDGSICACCGQGVELRSRNDYQMIPMSAHLDKDGYCRACAQWHKPLDLSGQWELGRLTRTQLNTLVRRYYAQEDCVSLIDEYEIDLAPEEFVKNCHWSGPAKLCRHCKNKTYYRGMNQEEYAEGYVEREIKCDSCGHEAIVSISSDGDPDQEGFGIEYDLLEYKDFGLPEQCACNQCEAERQRDPNYRRKLIREAYDSPTEMVPIYALSARQFVCLLGMLWSRTSKDKPDIILAPNIERMPLTPHYEQYDIQWDWIRTLTKEKVIYVDVENSPLDAFEEGNVNTYYMNKVTYLLNVTLDGETLATPAQILTVLGEAFRNGYWESDWTNELLPLWKDIATADCLAYVEERAQHFNLDVPNIEKLQEIFIKLLDEFSVSEIWYMISAAYMSAAAFYQTDKCKSLAHATNTVPSKIVSLSEQPRSQIKKWARIVKDIPRSAVSEVLFDIVLDTEGDAGFTMAPGRSWQVLLDRHLARNLRNEPNEFLDRYPLASDEMLHSLVAEYGDPRIKELVEFAIAARTHINVNH